MSLLIQAALARVESEYLLTAGNFASEKEVFTAFQKMLKTIQKKISGPIDIKVLKTAKSRSKYWEVSTPNLKTIEKSFLGLSRNLMAMSTAAQIQDPKDPKLVKEIIKIAKTMPVTASDDVDHFLMVAGDLIDTLTVASLVALGKKNQAKTFAGHMDTAVRDLLPDEVFE